MLDEVLTHLKDLKQTWEEAIKIATRERRQQEDPSYTKLPFGEEEDFSCFTVVLWLAYYAINW